MTLLPMPLQQAIKAYLTYRYQEQRVALKTLTHDLTVIVHFLGWAREHTTLTTYAAWDKEQVRKLVQQYLASMNVPVNTIYDHVSRLFTFFQALAQLELPHPPGYQIIPRLLPVPSKVSRQVPREEILDRVFREGVCQLDYDPLSRLALTIQYFCGTRITETCDLHLFCILEETNAQIYLLIPLGKTKRERLFPIVEVAMGLRSSSRSWMRSSNGNCAPMEAEDQRRSHARIRAISIRPQSKPRPGTICLIARRMSDEDAKHRPGFPPVV